MPRMINRTQERDELEALLPWYAAGTLSRSNADRVEQALAADRELAQRYEDICKELVETIYLNETLGEPSPRAAEKLFAAIDAEEGRTRRRQRLGKTSPSVPASLTQRASTSRCLLAALSRRPMRFVVDLATAVRAGMRWRYNWRWSLPRRFRIRW